MLTFIIPDNASAADIDKSLINQTMKRVMKAVDEFRPKREEFHRCYAATMSALCGAGRSGAGHAGCMFITPSSMNMPANDNGQRMAQAA